MFPHGLRLFFFAFAAFLTSVAAHAQSSEWKGIDKAQVRLVSAMSAIGEEDETLLGLQFKMEKGWKVYWRSPGDAGYPPEIDWTGSENLQGADMLWPRPERFMVLGLETIGYKGEVVYPLSVKVQDKKQPLNLAAKVRFLTCDDVCIPVEVDLSMELDAGDAIASEHAQLVNKYKSLVPLKNTQGIVTLDQAVLSEGEKGAGVMRFKLSTDWALNAPDAFSEGPVELAFFKPEISISKDKKSVLIDVPFDGLQFMETAPDSHDYTLTFMDGMRAFELSTKVDHIKEPLVAVDGFIPLELAQDSGLADLSLATILALAVLGGLILNLMPCVLPVLSLKVLGLVSHGGSSPKTVRLSFLASAAGILFSFLVLAGALIAMKAAGASIGWGIQFQQPIFLIALSLIVVLFACNMWGFFEINLPSWMSNIGADAAHSKGLGGHFLTGAFATVLATPCSAPFLGTAVGFALSQGTTEILLVFSALGVGLALPYLLIALFPKIATKLPKPGQWMVTLRKILGLVLLGTAVWLLSVLMVQIGLEAALMLAALMVVIIALLAFLPKLPKAAKGAVLGLFILAFFVPNFAESPEINQEEAEKLWVKFDQKEITKLVSEGQVVFVDVTAQWCITCQVNKNLVLYQGEAFEALSSVNVTPMKADWTKPDETIAAYLASFKKYAIPFNIVYGPEAPNGIVLPELLSEEDVLEAIKTARAS